MINRILEISLAHRSAVFLAAFVFIALGIYSVPRLPLDAVPDITNVQVQINASVPALAPEEIEKLVTVPIEIGMSGIENHEVVRSLSKPGLSQVTLIFKDGTDIYRARQLVGERLQSVAEALPPGVVPKLAPISTGLGEIFHYVVRHADGAQSPGGAEARLRELRQVQDYVIKPVLRTVPGVAEVNTSGGHETRIVVEPDPARLASLGLTLDDVARVIAANTANAGGAGIEKGFEHITVRVAGRVASIGEIAALPLKFASGAVALRVGDVCGVAVGSEVRTGAATHDGREAVLGSVMMLAGGNSREVSGRVGARLGELRANLPPGIVVESVYDRTALVSRTIATVGANLLEGALLVVAVLVALLGNWRAALIVAAGIPLSMLFAVTGMVGRGVPGNLMSLGAVDFGLIVDGAVVMTENIVRVLDQRRGALARELTRAERDAAVLDACRQAGSPTVFGVAVITIVYLPLFTLSGVEGRTFAPMAFTVVFALVGALLFALTLVPVLAAQFLRGRVRARDGVTVFARCVYLPVLRIAMRLRLFVVAVGVAGCAGALVLFNRLGSEFIPRLDEGDMAAQMIRTGSIALGASVEMQMSAERLLLEKFPEIRHVFSRVGTSEVATDPMGVNVGDTCIILKPREQWRRVTPPGGGAARTVSKDELAALMQRELAVRFPAQAQLFSQPVELRFNELLSGSRADVAIKVFGEDYDVLERLAGEVREIVERVPGAGEVEFDAIGRTPILQVEMDREAMVRYNVHADAVNAVINAAYAGSACGLVVDGERRFPVVTRVSGDVRGDFDRIRQLGVRTADGGVVPLGKVARVSVAEAVNTISRESCRRRVAVQVNLRGRDVAGFVAEARARIEAGVKFPGGYHVEYGGAFKNLEEARAHLALVVPVALVLIFVLVHMVFHSFRQVFVVYTAVPLALTGGVFALWLRGFPFSISAGVGFIALSGVAVLNGVVMVSFINQLRAAGRSLREAVEEGAVTRLRPVLMTALVASLGFVPMALSTGAGAEVQRPLATVVIGGILSTTFLTLLLLPTLYAWVERDD
ncbi:MAG: CusA/CzcA family heavy metal efflux RND transporter [Puniceicoccales bacterium]|jgi:cobalt-zinc-cadmium resistance protein CzcA|nr:CusA/CzcA family heavy metal efflux RND transporter [Puniceicoccales bacterium]